MTLSVRANGAAAAILALGTSCHAGDATIVYRVVAVQGQPAPGTGDFFGRLSSPFNNSTPRPELDEAGNQSLFAFLSGNQTGVWAERAGNLELLARGGQGAPGTDAFFFEFPAIEIPLAPMIAAGRSAFIATLSGPNVINTFNSHGTWSDRTGAMELVLRAADPVPGMPGVRFADPQPGAFNAQWHFLMFARLAGTGITADNDESWWTDRTGTFVPVAIEGSSAPGTEPGVTFGFGQIGAGPSVFPSAVMNDASSILFEATLAGPGIDSFNDEAFYLSTPQGTQLILREGDDAPGAGHNVTFGGNSVQLFLRVHSFTNSGKFLISMRLGGAIPTTDAMYSTQSGSLAPVVRAGEPAPGTGTNFTIVGGAKMNEAGRIAFEGSTATGFFPPLGVWWDQHGQISPLLLPGMVIPSLNNATLAGTSGIFGYAASGMILVRAGLNDPEYGPQSALLLIEPDGSIHKVAASGELFDSTGQGVFRTVYIITPGGLSETGEAAFRIRFTDETEGQYSARLGEACYANCDGSAGVPVLTANDFQCFINRYVSGDSYANCDGSTGTPALTANDFQCFINAYAAGCS